MRYVIEFDETVVEIIRECVEDLAPKIWHEAGADCSSVRIAAANYAGYGRYMGRCNPSGKIEIPTGNGFSRLVFEGRLIRLPYSDPDGDRLRGLVLHEIGHHVVFHARHQPWAGLRAGYSTHMNASWCWIAATGWRYFYPDWPGTPQMLGDLVLQSAGHEGAGIGEVLAHFEPNQQPPSVAGYQPIVIAETCEACGTALPDDRRRDARYCSAKCRMAAHRRRNASAQHTENTCNEDAA